MNTSMKMVSPRPGDCECIVVTIVSKRIGNIGSESLELACGQERRGVVGSRKFEMCGTPGTKASLHSFWCNVMTSYSNNLRLAYLSC